MTFAAICCGGFVVHGYILASSNYDTLFLPFGHGGGILGLEYALNLTHSATSNGVAIW